MDNASFERQLRERLHAKPFRPFLLEMNGGRQLVVSTPSVAFNGGAASIVDGSSEIHFVNAANVEAIRPIEARQGFMAGAVEEGTRMTPEQFEQSIRSYLHRDPFEPFIVRTGRNQLIVIENPRAVALAAGGAGYIGPNEIHFIESSDVVEIRSVREHANP